MVDTAKSEREREREVGGSDDAMLRQRHRGCRTRAKPGPGVLGCECKGRWRVETSRGGLIKGEDGNTDARGGCAI